MIRRRHISALILHVFAALSLLIIPVIYCIIEERRQRKRTA